AFPTRSIFVLSVLTGILLASGGRVTPDDAPAPKENPARKPWTTSRVVGSPEPPHPYRTERVFPKLSFRKGDHIEACPVGDRFFIVELDGKIVSFAPSATVDKTDPFLDLPREVKGCEPDKVVRKFGAVYAMTFHPQYAKNRYCYVSYMLDTHE